eukprot:m.347036 g.347036  ORF g.347036 m.347036 type:complete len:783 (-) comp55845_c0_seq4:879-3227(-)
MSEELVLTTVRLDVTEAEEGVGTTAFPTTADPALLNARSSSFGGLLNANNSLTSHGGSPYSTLTTRSVATALTTMAKEVQEREGTDGADTLDKADTLGSIDSLKKTESQGKLDPFSDDIQASEVASAKDRFPTEYGLEAVQRLLPGIDRNKSKTINHLKASLPSTIGSSEKSYMRKRETLANVMFHRKTTAGILHFSGVCYSIKQTTVTNGKKSTVDRQLIKNASGYALPGEMLALMGSSGAGKTTLMDILAGRKAKGSVTGAITVNGFPVKPDAFKHLAAYAMQEDVFVGTLTARETLLFACRLKTPHLSKEEIDERIQALLTDLAIDHVANSLVGSEMIRGLSGGERKRLSIALQLIGDPYFLFLDEPTTGLDSRNSLIVMERLKAIAMAQQKTVIFSIHQPRPAIYELIDRVMFLSRGEGVYFGPANQVTSTLSNLGYMCPPNDNPADFVIDIIVAAEYEPTGAEREELIKYNDFCFGDSDIVVEGPDLQKNADKNAGHASFIKQWYYLFSRELLGVRRNHSVVLAQLIQAIVVGVLVGLLYFQLGNSQYDMESRIGLLYMILMDRVFVLAGGSMSMFATIKLITEREQAGGLYTALPFFLSKYSFEIPLHFCLSMILSVIIYEMVGMNDGAQNFMEFAVCIWFISIFAITMYVMIGSATPNLRVAQLVSPYFTGFSLVGGGFVTVDQIPSALSWIPKLSFFRYFYEILMHNEFSGRTLTCTAIEIAAGTCKQTGDDLLKFMGMEDIDKSTNFGTMVGYTAFFFCASFFCIKYVRWEKR